jgi:O-antigen/teichoic acid export membrane protein
LGPAGIGTVTFVDSFTQYFLIFSTLGIPIYGVREISIRKDQPEELKRAFNEILLIHIICATTFSVIYIAAALLIPTLKVHFNIVSIGVVLVIFNVFMLEWFYQGIEQFSYITMRSLIVRSVTVVFLFTFLKPGSSSALYYAISASGAIITSLLNLYFLRKHVSIQFKYFNLKKHIKPLLTILGSTLAVSVYLLLDSIILGFIKGEAAVGIYTTAIRIVKLPFTVIVAISMVMVPQISRAYSSQNKQALHTLIDKSYSFICLLCMPLAVGMYISAPFLVHLISGNKFASAVLPLQILSPIIILVGLNNVFGYQVLTPIGKEKQMLVAVIAGMVVSLILNLSLIPFLSYTGAAITNLLTECVVTYVCYYYVKKNLPVNLNGSFLFKSFTGSLLFFPIAYLIRHLNINYMVKEVAVIVSCIIFYTLYVCTFIRSTYVDSFKILILSKIGLSTKLNNI